MLRSRCPGLKSRSRCPDLSASSRELSKCPLYLPVGCGDSGCPSEWQASGHSCQRKTRTILHRSSENLWVHSRNLESIHIPLRVECVDGVLQVTVMGAVHTRQSLPSYICHCLNTSCMRGRTSMLADHLLLVENLHGDGELHAPLPGDTPDLVLWDPGDA
jgi:hypothetical protein